MADSEKPSTTESKKSDALVGAILGIIAAIFIGLLAAAIIDFLLRDQPRCPNCNHRVNKDASVCDNCGISLRG